jgi:hypothetical protein
MESISFEAIVEIINTLLHIAGVYKMFAVTGKQPGVFFRAQESVYLFTD